MSIICHCLPHKEYRLYLTDADDWDKMKENNEDTMSLFEMKIEDIKTAIHDVRINVGKMRHFQFMRGGAMSKDVHQVHL